MLATNSVNILKWFKIQFLVLIFGQCCCFQQWVVLAQIWIIALLDGSWLVPSHRTEHKILSRGGHLSTATNTTFKIMSWPKSKSISSLVSSLPLWELSLHPNQSDFPPLSGSISFHNKNQFSVTLPSPVKVNSPHADIHIQMSLPVTTALSACTSSTVQPTASLHELIWFAHRQPKSTLSLAGSIPSSQLNSVSPHWPSCPSFHDTGMSFCPALCPSGALISFYHIPSKVLSQLFPFLFLVLNW